MMAETAVAAPETGTRAVYGVVWNGHVQPLTDYQDEGEARRVAGVLGGQVLVRYEYRSGWMPL